MDFRCVYKTTWLSTILLIIISCGQRKEAEDASAVNEEETPTVAVDSIVFKTSNEEYVYLGKRLYPSNSLDSADGTISSDVLSIESIGDTVFAFLNTEMLNNQSNAYLPQADDSLLKYYYPQHYDVEIDDDIPYVAYLRSVNDYLQFIRGKSGVFYLETATIRDTVMRVFGDIKVGLNKEAVFAKLGFPNNLVSTEDFSLILCHGAVPYKIWFNPNEYSEQLPPAEVPTLQVLLQFENSQLKHIYIDPWIGYDRKNISSDD